MKSWIVTGSGAALTTVLALGAVNAQEQGFQEARAKFAARDTNHDGRLTPDEFPGDAALFRRADRDGDGGVTEREAIRLVVLLKGSAKAKQELSRRFRAGDRNGDGALTAAEVPQAAAKLAEIDADGDGRVTWAEAVRAGAGEFVAKAFAQADRNHDGALSGDEIPADKQALCVAADDDGDGRVTAQEATALVIALHGDAPATSAGFDGAAPAELGVVGVVHATFGRLDRDGDGALDAREFPGTASLRERWDLDRDGRVDRAEVEVKANAAQELRARGERLRALAVEKGVSDPAFAAAGLEVKGLFAAGRLDEARALLDRIELHLHRAGGGR